MNVVKIIGYIRIVDNNTYIQPLENDWYIPIEIAPVVPSRFVQDGFVVAVSGHISESCVPVITRVVIIKGENLNDIETSE